MKSNTLTYLKATALVAFFIFISLNALAISSQKDIAQKAQELVLEKKGGEAQQLLLGALKKEAKKSPKYLEILSLLENLSRIFISEKAQQLYELAISEKNTEKLNAAAELEPYNIQISMELARIYLSKNDCDLAAKEIRKLESLRVYIEEINLITAQTLICSHKTDEYTNLRQTISIDKSKHKIAWLLNDVALLIKLKNYEKANELILEIQKKDKENPEINFWLWKTNSLNKENAKKYQRYCSSADAFALRKYRDQPFLCSNLTEIETLAK